jgi:aminocarboxymuconate-semialdehyde decarboxylase
MDDHHDSGCACDAAARAIDIHAHFYPAAYLDLLTEAGERYGITMRRDESGFSIGPRGPFPLNFVDLSLRLEEMDRRGVTIHALSLTEPMIYWAEPELQARLARAFNDGASAAHLAHPTRFVGLMALPMLDPDRALDELDRASRLPGMRGVYLGTNIQDRDLDDPLFQPIFARIEALDLPIFLHPIKTLGGARTRPFYLGNLIGNPLDTAIAAAHLICGGVLDRFPKLEICLPHAGGVLPILSGRLDQGYRVRPELKHLPQAPSAYLRRFTYDTVSHSKEILKFVIAQIGIDRIMLGSDYCFDMGYEQPIEVVDGLDLSSAERAMVLHGTAARLLKL